MEHYFSMSHFVCFDFTVELLVLILILKQNVIADEVAVNMALAFSICVFVVSHIRVEVYCIT